MIALSIVKPFFKIIFRFHEDETWSDAGGVHSVYVNQFILLLLLHTIKSNGAI